MCAAYSTAQITELLGERDRLRRRLREAGDAVRGLLVLARLAESVDMRAEDILGKLVEAMTELAEELGK